MSIWLPDSVHEAALAEQTEQSETMARFNAELETIDPYLRLIKASEKATTPGLKPGYFHILRIPPGGPPSVQPVEGAMGEYREPDAGLFQELKETDLWNSEVKWEREKMIRAAERARRRQRDRERADRVEEVLDAYKAKHEPGVSMTTAGTWTNRAKARRG